MTPARRRVARSVLAALTACCVCPSLAEPTPAPSAKPHLAQPSFGETYPLEVSAEFHAALLHWLDSLANLSGPGATAGKTVELHRATYVEVLGEPTAEDVRQLKAFVDVRLSFRERGRDVNALTRAFFDAPNLEAARRASRELLASPAAEAFEAALAHFEGRYRPLWNGGRVIREFLESAGGAITAEALTNLLADVKNFYAVELAGEPQPRLVLTPIAAGHGTHAQAIDRHLLVEVRAGDVWRDQVAPIVHENAHYLFKRISAERLALLQAAAEGASANGGRAWRALGEALPTAIAQGWAESRLNPGRWSKTRRWYHDDAIDAYAKRIYPRVRACLEQSCALDAALVADLARVW